MSRNLLFDKKIYDYGQSTARRIGQIIRLIRVFRHMCPDDVSDEGVELKSGKFLFMLIPLG
jgi:hypothetical protein